MEYASRAVGNAGLATGIVGTALGVLNGGAGILGMMGGSGQGENTFATRYDIANLKELMAKDQEIAILKSEQTTEIKIADVYERLITRINQDQRDQSAWNAQQMVNNAQMSAAIAANATSISALQNCCSQITKTVIPNTSICPGWGPVTITPAGGTTVG